MKKGLKLLAAGTMVAASMLVQDNVKAVTNINYSVDVYSKYSVVTDEDTFTIPNSYKFADDYNLSLTPLQNNLESIKNKNQSILSYDADTKELRAKTGLHIEADSKYDVVLLSPNAKVTNDYASAVNNEKLIRIAECLLLNKSKKTDIAKYQVELDKVTTEYDRNKYSSLIQDYQEDVARMDTLNLNDIATKKDVYNALLASNVTARTSMKFSSTTGKHVGDDVNIAYHYYVILLRDLRLDKVEYKVNSGEYEVVPQFDKDTRVYNVYLSPSTPKNATITTKSLSYASADDERREYVYDNGINITEGTVTLNNGVGTTKVKVEFDGTPYGITERKSKEYTINFSILDYQKGDVNKDRYINSTDAALVLDYFKNENATVDAYRYGDMNNDNQLNANDAAMIIDIFKVN